MKKDAFLRTWKPGVYSEFWDILDFLMEMGQQGENWLLALSPSLPTLGSILHYQDLVYLCGHSSPQVPALAILISLKWPPLGCPSGLAVSTSRVQSPLGRTDTNGLEDI